MSTQKLLIAFDGSPNAQSAIDAAADLFPDSEAIVFYARQPMEAFAAHLQGHPLIEELKGLDAAALDSSEQVAAEGARRARDRGLDATPMVASSLSTASEAIIDAAEEHDATLIVLGSRGLRGVTATLLGSTSTNVLHHATRPTLVIPSDAVATARRESRRA